MSRKALQTSPTQRALVEAADKVMAFLDGPQMVHVSSTAPDGCLWVRVEARDSEGSMGVSLGHPLLEQFRNEMRGRGVRVFDSEEEFDSAVHEGRARSTTEQL